MISLQLAAIAMNPNLTAKQFHDLSMQVMESRIRMVEEFNKGLQRIAAADQFTQSQRLEMMLKITSLCVPLWF